MSENTIKKVKIGSTEYDLEIEGAVYSDDNNSEASVVSIVGKIKTLFSDKDKTEALFPRTKVSAISDDDGTGLNVLLDKKSQVQIITWENDD